MTLPMSESGKRSDSSSEEATTAADERKQQPALPLKTAPPPPPPLPPPLLLPPAARFPPQALQARDEGNAAMRAGEFSAAVVLYSKALLSLVQSERKGDDEKRNHELACALVLSNRAAARLSLGHFSKAAADSLEALELCRCWWRPWARLARARAGAGDTRGAVRACREGGDAAVAAAAMAAAAPLSSSAAEKKLPLLPTRERVAAQIALRAEADSIALAAAHEGRFDGFDGAVLEVRPAESGSEWLGLPAPPRDGERDSESSGDEDENSSARRICSSGGSGSSSQKALAVSLSKKEQKRQTSFRSLLDALAAAQDGDVIRMLPGTHNGLGRSAVIDKRVMIDGRGGERGGGGGGSGSVFTDVPFPPLSAPAAATLDARGNVPALRFRRPAAVVGLVIDATGFREAVRVDPLLPLAGSGRGSGSGSGSGGGGGDARVLVAGCSVSSSGDDGAVAAGSLARLTLLGCEVTAGRAGARAFAGGDIELRGCLVKGCGTHGLAAQALSPSSPFLASSNSVDSLGGRVAAKNCRISSCREEGALCSGRGSSLVLEDIEIEACRGPAVDASGKGCSVLLRGGTRISECSGGGLWLWRGARGRVSSGKGGGGRGRCLLSCEETFAVLTDGEGTRLEIEERGCCEVRGGVKGAEAEAAVVSSFPAPSDDDDHEAENGNGNENSNAATTAKQQQRPPRHCGPPPEVGPFRWDGPDPLRAE